MQLKRVTMLVFIFCSCCMAAFAEEEGLDIRAVLKAWENDTQVISEKLGDEAIWQDKTREKRLLLLLEAAGRLRIKAAVPALVKHLDHVLVHGDPDTRIPLEKEFPAIAAIIGIGVPSVPHLIQVLKDVDPASKQRGEAPDLLQVLEDVRLGNKQGGELRKRTLAIYAIISIYGGGTDGKQLARTSIALAAGKLRGGAKDSLLQALDHFLLKVDADNK